MRGERQWLIQPLKERGPEFYIQHSNIWAKREGARPCFPSESAIDQGRVGKSDLIRAKRTGGGGGHFESMIFPFSNLLPRDWFLKNSFISSQNTWFVHIVHMVCTLHYPSLSYIEFLIASTTPLPDHPPGWDRVALGHSGHLDMAPSPR